MQGKGLDFFLGALSPSGFCSYYTQALPDADTGTAVLLKAGPGCGKSTLLKRAAQKLLDEGETVERIHCAGDPASLDGVLCAARRLAILDATPPHTLEPSYPVAFEDVVSLYGSLDRAALRRDRAEILELFRQYKTQTERATRYITAAGSLIQDSMRVALCCTDLAKARSFAKTLGRRYLPMAEGPAQEDVRLLSAITLAGQVFYADTIRSVAATVVALEDEYGAASRALMQSLREEALAKGHHVITCYCSVCPFEKIEHLLLPGLRLAFVTSNSHHTIRFEGQRTIHCTRFTQKEGIRLRRKRLRFNRKATAELLEQAAGILAEAKLIHDRLEAYYRQANNRAALEDTYREMERLL